MFRALLQSIVIMFVVSTALAKPSIPLGLDWSKKHSDYPTIKNYKYYYGDVPWGLVIYLGLQDIIGLETEMQLSFANRKISRAVLILGPAGLNDENCVAKYKKVVTLYNTKYGHYRYQKVLKDPLLDDLLYLSACYPMRKELYSIDTYWHNKRFKIKASVFGDQDGLYIEIVYTNLNLSKDLDRVQIEKILKEI